MVGAEPAALRSPSFDAATVQAPVPTVQFVEKGRIRQLVSIRNSAATYQVWTLTFSPNGELMSAAREEHPVEPATPVVLQAATPASPTASPSAANVASAVAAPAANPTLPQPAVASQPAPAAAPTQPTAPSTLPAEVTATAPQPVAPPAAVVTSVPIVQRNLPEPPHRFIPNPPPPPSRIIPSSALQSPPHLSP